MRTNEKILYILIILIFTTGCSSDNQIKNGLPCIDIRKKYPVKEIILTDMADVSYVHLSTENKDFLYKGRINCVTENTIIVGDNSSGSILFFSKDGTPMKRFNRYGVGPEEYQQIMFQSIIFNETTDETFVLPAGVMGKFIFVYSSSGEFRRKIELRQITAYMIYSFDEQSLLVYDAKKVTHRTFAIRNPNSEPVPTSIDSSFIIISKTDGKVLDYVRMPNNDIDLSITRGSGYSIPIYNRVTESEEGFYLCNHETDTVFLYKRDKSLTPVLCKTPLAGKLNPAVILDNCADVGKYQFMVVETLVLGETSFDSPKKYLLRDKKTGEIFNQKIILSEYKGKEIFITPENIYFNGKEMQACITLNLYELKQAFDENRLSGKLKELVATLNEDEDNNVFMFVTFR